MEKIIPTPKQLEFLSWEMGIFFHFGIRSFFLGHRDWDDREMPASEFNPTNLDCEQWIRSARDAGFKYAVMTAKHHDGFALWPSKYTDYCVKNSKWKNGKGDAVAEYVAACRKYGFKVGIYYSPAQWGGSINYKDEKEYDDYFINQIGELLTNYGEIDYLWFDGCGSENHKYDEVRIIKEIRSMQPDIMIFGMWDPDTRWVGNEDGYAESPNFSVVRDIDFSMMTEEKKSLRNNMFLPAECDFKMRGTWFDCELNADTIKEVDELVGIYEYSVGRGANFLLNIGPSRDGSLPPLDTIVLKKFGDEIKRRYGKPIGSFAPPVIENGKYVIKSCKNELVNRIIIKEDLTKGESVKSFKVYAHLPHYTNKMILVYTGTTVGHKAICAIPTMNTAKIVVEITDSIGDYTLSDVSAYYV